MAKEKKTIAMSMEGIRASVTAHVIEVTNTWAVEHGFTGAKKDEDPRATEIRKRLAKRAGTIKPEYLTVIAEISSVITGLDIRYLSDAAEFVAGLAVVPLKSSNDHNYPLGKVCLSPGTAHSGLMRLDGSAGNTLATGDGDFRPATDEEITAFVKEISVAGLSKMMPYLVE